MIGCFGVQNVKKVCFCVFYAKMPLWVVFLCKMFHVEHSFFVYIRFAMENAKMFLNPAFFKTLAHSFIVDAVVMTSSIITIF